MSEPWRGEINVFVDSGLINICVIPPKDLDDRILDSLAPWIEETVNKIHANYADKRITRPMLSHLKMNLERRLKFSFEIHLIAKGIF